MAKEVVHADVALVPGISVLAVADCLQGGWVQLTSSLPGKVVPARLRVWTLALSALDLISSYLWSSVVADDAFVTEVAHGRVTAVVADASLWMARVSVTVALALLAVGEVPVARLALVALPTKRWLECVALTLTRVLVAELILAACSVAVTPVQKLIEIVLLPKSTLCNPSLRRRRKQAHRSHTGVQRQGSCRGSHRSTCHTSTRESLLYHNHTDEGELLGR